MAIECPITKEVIQEKAIAPDGITYERKALLKYIRKYHKSPVTGEPLCMENIVFDSTYYESKEEKAEKIVDRIRSEVEQYIDLKKQHANFENIPENIIVSLKKNSDQSWSCYAENSKDTSELPERVVRSIQHYASAMFFYIAGDNSRYVTTNLGNGRLQIKGSDKINILFKNHGNVILTKWNSFHKEFNVKKWLNDICAEDILSIPIRCILGLEQNKPILHEKKDFDVSHLNNEQQMVFKHENFKHVQVVEGPPGTGKTTVISTLLDYIETTIGQNKKHITIVLSEKNRGVEAVSEKLKPEHYWKVLSFGSDNMGESTKQYLIENKVTYHKIFVDTYNRIQEIQEQCEQKIRKLKRLVFNVLPRNTQKQLHWTNMNYIKYKLQNANMKNGVKKNKIHQVLADLDLFIAQIQYVQSQFNATLKQAENSLKDQCSIVLVTFGSLHQVSQFFKDLDKNISLSIIIDESSTLLSWQGFYIERFVNEMNATLTNIILVGDSKQLPPYWPDHNISNQEKTSFLDLAKTHIKHVAFTQQYRLPNQIMNILNKEYYKESPLVLGHTRMNNHPIHWNHSDGVNDGEANYLEAHNIFKLLYLFYNKHILIISPYRTQCEILEKLCVMYSTQNIHIMTLDSVQGHEADVVIVSLVKSTPTTFLTSKRTCVLVSRVREKLIVFGNRQNCLISKNGCLRKLARYSGLKI